MKRILLGVLAALLTAAGAAAAPDLGKMSAGELTAVMHAFPKGGELHNHVTGGIYGETLLTWAAEDGYCVDLTALALRAVCTSGGGKPAAAVLADEGLRSAMIDSLSTRHPGFRGRSGHDQFFTAFDRIAAKPDRLGDILAVVLDGLARQNTFYAELKTAARNAIAFSFLSGEGLWTDPNVYRKPARACAGQIGNPEPKGACFDLVTHSDKAREQWRHERLLKAFEAGR